MYHFTYNSFRTGTLVFSFLLATCGLMLGQAVTASGSLAGTVTDSTGAVVAGASVTVASSATGISRSGTTSGEGNYRFDSLPPGVYTVKATKAGFVTATAPAVELEVSNTT